MLLVKVVVVSKPFIAGIERRNEEKDELCISRSGSCKANFGAKSGYRHKTTLFFLFRRYIFISKAFSLFAVPGQVRFY